MGECAVCGFRACESAESVGKCVMKHSTIVRWHQCVLAWRGTAERIWKKPAPLSQKNVIRTHIHFAVARRHLLMPMSHDKTFRRMKLTAARIGFFLVMALATANAITIININIISCIQMHVLGGFLTSLVRASERSLACTLLSLLTAVAWLLLGYCHWWTAPSL